MCGDLVVDVLLDCHTYSHILVVNLLKLTFHPLWDFRTIPFVSFYIYIPHIIYTCRWIIDISIYIYIYVYLYLYVYMYISIYMYDTIWYLYFDYTDTCTSDPFRSCVCVAHRGRWHAPHGVTGIPVIYGYIQAM